VLKALNEYQELSPRLKTPEGSVMPIGASAMSSRSGGADIAADEVSVDGDVVGRDKIVQAGGHIIIARDSAQVIINGEDRSLAEYQ
jgi:hypothetical protein